MKKYKDRYLVSPYGAVYDSLRKKWLKISTQSLGYKQVFINGKLEYLHRVVGTCFCKNSQNLKEINHIDGNKGNNCFLNLEWVTHKANMRHAHESGLKSFSIEAMMKMHEVRYGKKYPIKSKI